MSGLSSSGRAIPASFPCPAGDSTALLRRYKTHELYTSNSKTLAEAAKPEKFTADIKWQDWCPTFLNYLRAIPGRDGVPLKYVCRTNPLPDPTPQRDLRH